MNLQFINRSKSSIPKKYIFLCMEYTERQLSRRKVVPSLKNKRLDFVFLGSHSMRRLNKKYRGRDRVTDVLSFPSIFKDHLTKVGGDGQLGELVFCPQMVKRQAKQNGHSYRDELAYLSIHGFLHLLGFEHDRGGEKAKLMYELQDSLFFGFVSHS